MEAGDTFTAQETEVSRGFAQLLQLVAAQWIPAASTSDIVQGHPFVWGVEKKFRSST